MSGSQVPQVAFLGLIERWVQLQDGDPRLLKYNILGLKQHVLPLIYPHTLSGSFAFALYNPQPSERFNLVWRSDLGSEVGTIEIATTDPFTIEAGEPLITAKAPILRAEGPVVAVLPEGWVFLVFPLTEIKFMFNTPGSYHLYLKTDEGETKVGSPNMCRVNLPPLTEAKIAAIKSNPTAMKAVRLELRCNLCNDALRTYAGLERNPKQEEEGWIWYETLGDSFDCTCKKMSVDLTIIRSNLHGYLGREDSNVHEVSFIPAYEREALQNIRKNFRDLLDNGAPEEVIQKFIEENPVLLHPFSPKDLWFKAPVLTFCKTDFAILSHASELLLIELEKPQTRILKKDGGVHSELQHAFDQVRDWLHLADEHRQAFVECIGAEPKQVGAVKGTVIAGRDAGCNPNHLRKLKGADLGRTKFMTYDDLFASFEALLRALDKT